MTTISNIGTKIRELRVANDTKQADLAQLIGISPSKLSKIETDIIPIHIDLLIDICYVFDEQLSSILDDVNESQVKVPLEGIEATLNQRQQTHGYFPDVATTSQNIKNAMSNEPEWDKLSTYQSEALTVIAQKIARILNGNPNEPDHWHDIAGYATLVEKELIGK